jgi:hypothetical protein
MVSGEPINHASNIEECHEACQDHEQCEGFGWNEEGFDELQCYLDLYYPPNSPESQVRERTIGTNLTYYRKTCASKKVMFKEVLFKSCCFTFETISIESVYLAGL